MPNRSGEVALLVCSQSVLGLEVEERFRVGTFPFFMAQGVKGSIEELLVVIWGTDEPQPLVGQLGSRSTEI